MKIDSEAAVDCGQPVKEKAAPKPKKKTAKKKSREDINQTAARIVKEATEKS
ncbi:hypothetical protein H7849_16475 [Alloacidobacterium dinghuense]|uniref:Uncharacterized protein n=1 Tax=Alloacidobacterium dinghuense TaxID=2763107 RepID=A0A7G8BDU6_9BACT|nr:hypothetical protein [Alloacidobacterium dinghuense]QNI30716.1 hypothetical protein H7849_16475 [Alloacidobacterium dinghuense]